MKEILGLIGVGIFFTSAFPYYRDIFRGKTRPHLYTYLVWSIVTTLVFFGQYAAGGGPGAWRTGIAAVTTIGIFILCFKYGTEDVTRFDKLCLVGALISVVPWILTRDPMLSVVLATCIDVLAFFPTIRKTYRNPSTESLTSWIMNVVSHGFSIFALAVYSVTTLVFPIAIFSMNLVLVSVIIARRRT